MEHTDIKKTISHIALQNKGLVYEIHDAKAIHSIEELGLSNALVFRGTQPTDADILTITDASVGDVWLSTDTNTEYVCVTEVFGTANSNAWEKLGNVHDAASSNHTHFVTGTNLESSVSGNVMIPTISATQKYMSAVAAEPDVITTTDSVLGVNTKFTVHGGNANTTNIKATASGVAVAGNGTANAITGFGAHTTDTALGTGATFKVSGGAAQTSKMVTSTASKVTVSNKSIPNVTGNSEVKASKVTNTGSKTNGTAATWSATVEDGVLVFNWVPNNPTAVTLPTFSEVTATKTTLGTAISASSVTASDVTVATGALSSSGAGSSVATGISTISVAVNSADTVTAITALGTPTTAAALTGVKVTSQPTVTLSTGATAGTGVISVATGIEDISISASGDNVTAITSVDVAPSIITLTNNDAKETGYAPVVSDVAIGSAFVSLQNGKAAAQVWTGSTDAPST